MMVRLRQFTHDNRLGGGGSFDARDVSRHLFQVAVTMACCVDTKARGVPECLPGRKAGKIASVPLGTIAAFTGARRPNY
jgi:hypothetical protein